MYISAHWLLFCLLCLFSGPLLPQLPADSSLVLYLPFRAGAQDESAWRHRVVEHQATYGADRYGQCDGAFYGDGAEACLEIPPAAEFDLTGSLTLSLWAKAEESLPTNAELTLLWQGADIAHPVIRLGMNGLVFIGLEHAFVHVPNPERWDHYAACRDTLNKEIRLYLNAQLKATISLFPQHPVG